MTQRKREVAGRTARAVMRVLIIAPRRSGNELLSLALLHGVAEDADGCDLHFDDVAGRHPAGAAGRAGVDDIAGQEVTQPLIQLTMPGQSKIRSEVYCFCTDFAVEAGLEAAGCRNRCR